MNFINSILTTATEWVLYPFAGWPLITLLVVSAITGVLVTYVFRYTSNQKALRSVVDRIQAHLLAIKLFKDDFYGMFGSMCRILQLAAARIWYSLSPVFVMLIPLVLLLSQLALRYEHRPLTVGETSVVELKLTEDAWNKHQIAKLKPNSLIDIETEPLRDASQHSVFWRVKPKSGGRSMLQWDLGTTAIEKEIVVADDTLKIQKVNRRRASSGLMDQLLYPGEPAFDSSSPVETVEIHYPRRDTPVVGWKIPWWLTFVVISIVVAMLMQPVLGVRF